MATTTMCPCPSIHHELPQWKCVFVVLINAQVLSYSVRRQIKIQQESVKQYIFMSAETFQILQCIADIYDDGSKNVTLTSITNNRKILYAGVCKS